MRPTLIGFAVLLAAFFLATPATASPCKTKLCRVEAQNRALRAQVRDLKQKLATTRDSLATAQQRLATAQRDVAGAISTMPPAMIWGLFPVIAITYSTPVWSNSYFSSGQDYESWTFTRCGFC